MGLQDRSTLGPWDLEAQPGWNTSDFDMEHSAVHQSPKDGFMSRYGDDGFFSLATISARLSHTTCLRAFTDSKAGIL